MRRLSMLGKMRATVIAEAERCEYWAAKAAAAEAAGEPEDAECLRLVARMRSAAAFAAVAAARAQAGAS